MGFSYSFITSLTANIRKVRPVLSFPPLPQTHLPQNANHLTTNPQLLGVGKLTDCFNRLMAPSTLLLVAVLPVSSLVFNVNLYPSLLVLALVWRRCWVLLMLPVTCVLFSFSLLFVLAQDLAYVVCGGVLMTVRTYRTSPVSGEMTFLDQNEKRSVSNSSSNKRRPRRNEQHAPRSLSFSLFCRYPPSFPLFFSFLG